MCQGDGRLRPAHKLTEEKLLDLSGSSIIEIEFVVTDTEAQQLLNLLHREKVPLIYAYVPARFGVIDTSAADPPLP